MKYLIFLLLIPFIIIGSLLVKKTILQNSPSLPNEDFRVTFDETLLHSNLYPPSELHAKNITSTEITISWEYASKNLLVPSGMAPEYAIFSGFRIYRDGYWFADVPKTQSVLTDRGLYPGEKYTYNVSALTFDDKIEGSKSANLFLMTKSDAPRRVSSPKKKFSRYLAEGDSITKGQKAVKGIGYVDQIGKFLSIVNPDVSVFNKGESGAFSSAIEGRLLQDIEETQPDFITIAVGVNDVVAKSRDIGNISMEEYSSHLRKSIQMAKERNISIIILNIFYIDCCHEKIIAWNKLVRDVAYEYGVALVDVYNAMKNNGSRELLEDALHPNQKGHNVIAQVVIDWLQ